LLAVPLVHVGEAIGVIFIWRSEVRPLPNARLRQRLCTSKPATTRAA